MDGGVENDLAAKRNSMQDAAMKTVIAQLGRIYCPTWVN
jgi:hypothetical protein